MYQMSSYHYNIWRKEMCNSCHLQNKNTNFILLMTNKPASHLRYMHNDKQFNHMYGIQCANCTSAF